MPTRKRYRRSRAGMTGGKAYELLTGRVASVYVNYCGYAVDGGKPGRLESVEFDRDAMELDWEDHGAALTAFWRSGLDTMSSTLAQFGIVVKISPGFFECGGPGKVPWAAKFLAAKSKRKAVAKRAVSK